MLDPVPGHLGAQIASGEGSALLERKDKKQCVRVVKEQ